MTTSTGLVRQVNINQEMRDAYLDYAMSVIVSRALPDVRDGLKPVHRRILYAMYDMGLRADSPYKKSARIVGEVLGKYHPHGDASVYDAMVRLAQNFSMRYELVDGQGNFGSIDGDAPAAMRYTEARMANLGLELLADINKDTVDFTENFDGSLVEPAVMPCSVPNLLVNGSSGIAVGMSTNIPPHNFGEVCEALVFMLENWEHIESITAVDLMEFIKGPDFPTAGIVFTHDAAGEDGLMAAYATGRGKITMRARAHVEQLGRGRSRIIVSQIPFQINKTSLIERIVTVAQEGKIEGLVDLRDESDRQGLRLVIEVGRNADPYDVLELLFKYTPLQTTFGVIMLALVDGEPRTLPLKQMLKSFIEHRLEVIRRRSQFDLSRAQERAHILEGLLAAIGNIDQVIAIIRESKNAEAAQANLMQTFDLSEAQADAILEMQLRRLAALERRKLEDELKEKHALIRDLTTLLSSEKLMRLEIARETKILMESYSDQRRTLIVNNAPTEVTAGMLVEEENETWVTVTIDGKVSRPHGEEAPKVTAAMKEPPFRVLGTTPSDILYFITERGFCAAALASQVPKTNDINEGVSFHTLCDLSANDTLANVISLPPGLETGYLFFVSELGEVKRLKVDDLPGLRATQFKIFDVEAEDRLRWVFYVTDEDTVVLVTRAAQAIHFNVEDVRPSGLTAGGMRGIKLSGEQDRVVGAGPAMADAFVWVATDEGVGKRSAIEEYPVQGRAGGGVRTMKLPPGQDVGLVTALIGREDWEMVALTTKGTAKRSKLANTALTKRDYKGDVAVSLAKSEQVAEAFFFIPRVTPLLNGGQDEELPEFEEE